MVCIIINYGYFDISSIIDELCFIGMFFSNNILVYKVYGFYKLISLIIEYCVVYFVCRLFDSRNNLNFLLLVLVDMFFVY